MATTFIDRENTNEKVLQAANTAIQAQGGESKPLQAYSQHYKKRKLAWLEEVIRLEDNDPLKYTTFKPHTLGNWDVGTKVQGRPKTQWADTGKSQYWQQIQHNLDQPLKEQTWQNTPQQNESMEKMAR